MNQPPPEFNPQLPPSSNQNIQQNIESSIVEGDIQIIQGNNNTQTKIINYYYESFRQNDASSDDNLPCPYKGLSHFSPDDAELFFGRDEFVQELIDATTSHSFIPVLGASGSGKTSVVLAGLVPELQKKGNWLFIHFRPGSNPFQRLAEAFVALDASLDQAHELANNLAVLPDLLNKIHQKYSNQRLLLIADQLEELYISCPDETIRQRFLDCLLAIIQYSPNKSKSLVVLVATMRADFLDRALEYRPFADLLKDNLMLIKPMNRDELKQVIEKPSQGLKVTFEVELVKRILDDVEKQPGSLPLLEFALTLLWEQRKGKQLTHATYEAIGKVPGAIASHAEAVYKNLDATDKEQVRRIFLQLVCPGEGTEDTRRLATKAELGENSWSLVQRLANAKTRLVVISRTAEGRETVEVVHEALIREWQRLSGWIDDNRQKLLQKNRIERLALEWQKNKKLQDYLLQGKQLNEAKAFEKEEFKNFVLSDSARKFIKKSIKYERSRALKTGSLLAIPLLIAFVAVVPFIRKANELRALDTIQNPKNPGVRGALELLSQGCWAKSKWSWMPDILTTSLFGNCTNLEETNLSGTNLSRADLRGANLKNIILSDAYLLNANLIGANLNSANLNSANFISANLIGANLIGANLKVANFLSTYLNSANLSSANLYNAKLSSADLRGANLRGANLRAADLGCIIKSIEKHICTNLKGVKNFTYQQVKATLNWEQACYDPELRKQLNLPPENPKNCAGE